MSERSEAPELPDRQFRTIFLLESRAWYDLCKNDVDLTRDLVLTYDFALKGLISDKGGVAFYIDHLVDHDTMQRSNYALYDFFKIWHKDGQGRDIFNSAGCDFGFALRLDIWNDLTFLVRNSICLATLRRVQHERILVGSTTREIGNILDALHLGWSALPGEATSGGYYFHIHRWMDEKLRKRSLRNAMRDWGTLALWHLGRAMDCFKPRPRRTIFVHEYYPTRDILRALLSREDIRVIQAHFSYEGGWRKYLSQRALPQLGNVERHRATADVIMRDFAERRSANLIVTGAGDITASAYQTLERRLYEVLPRTLAALDSVAGYLRHERLDLVVLIANVGLVPTLVDCATRSADVPTYLIINGIMFGDFLDEAKYATIINSYSSSIKQHYYRNAGNVVCLGDPRMDAYAPLIGTRVVNRRRPTITIGASSFSIVDLNSYVAVEFDFLHEVLQAIQAVEEDGAQFSVILKVRPSSDAAQYRDFVTEYFPGLVDQIVQHEPFIEVAQRTDLYISLYSQTLFEASCLGVPVIYYKGDCEKTDPPFDGNSELVMARAPDELIGCIKDFIAGHPRYDEFLRRDVMEKYIGPLDGNNTARNLAQIDEMLSGTPRLTQFPARAE